MRPKKPQGTEQLGRNSCPTWGRSCGKKKEHARTRGHRLFEIGKEHFSQRLNCNDWFSWFFRHIGGKDTSVPFKTGNAGLPQVAAALCWQHEAAATAALQGVEWLYQPQHRAIQS